MDKKPATTGSSRRSKRSRKRASPLPMRHGVSASRVWLPKSGHSVDHVASHRPVNELDSPGLPDRKSGEWNTIFDFFVERFPFLPEEMVKDRMTRGHIVRDTGEAVNPDTPYQPETHLYYYREIPNEPAIPFHERILHKDDNIIVVDKPHFVPVTPTGRFIRESLLSRLKHRYQNEHISPVHRLDRDTAGVMLFSCNPDIRGAYQNLFQKRQVHKTYEAIAPLASRQFPYTHRSHIASCGTPFFIMQEIEQALPNTETVMDIIETDNQLARYKLEPVTGRQHQLRVHMMSIGCPIMNDPFYPVLLPEGNEDYERPLQLLAKTLEFVDPLTQEPRRFTSESRLLNLRDCQ